MAQQYYEDWKKSTAGKKALLTWVRDPEGLLTGNGYCEGVYQISFVNENLHLEVIAYIGQAGYNQTAPTYVARNVYERILEHLKRWLGGDHTLYWTGLDDSEAKEWKIKLHLLSEEKTHGDRLRKESEYIARYKPFLQDSAGGLYEFYPTKYAYARNDLCIHPWTREGDSEGQRRLALLHRIKEMQKSK